MYTYPCKILGVIDGDTLDIELDLGFNIKMKERVRLLDVDTPEVFGKNAVAEGRIASDFTNKWIKDRETQGRFVYESKKYNAREKYGRSLGYIRWIGASNRTETLNEALINSGNIK